MSTARSAHQKGFTLIEMIGVLAIIAILVAAIAPRIFEAIEDSKVTSGTTLVKTVQTAVTKYYADVGSLYGFNVTDATNPAFAANNGGNFTSPAPAANLASALTTTKAAQNTGTWAKFRGPYLDAFVPADPPIGAAMRLSSVAATATGAVAATDETNYDLTNDGNSEIPAGSQVVSLVFSGIQQREAEKIDNILDANLAEGRTLAERFVRGRVKYDAGAAGGTIRIYIAHK